MSAVQFPVIYLKILKIFSLGFAGTSRIMGNIFQYLDDFLFLGLSGSNEFAYLMRGSNSASKTDGNDTIKCLFLF